MLARTPAQRRALEYFLRRHKLGKIRGLHFSRRIGYWICLVGAVSYHAKPAVIRVRHAPRRRRV